MKATSPNDIAIHFISSNKQKVCQNICQFHLNTLNANPHESTSQSLVRCEKLTVYFYFILFWFGGDIGMATLLNNLIQLYCFGQLSAIGSGVLAYSGFLIIDRQFLGLNLWVSQYAGIKDNCNIEKKKKFSLCHKSWRLPPAIKWKI